MTINDGRLFLITYFLSLVHHDGGTYLACCDDKPCSLKRKGGEKRRKKISHTSPLPEAGWQGGGPSAARRSSSGTGSHMKWRRLIVSGAGSWRSAHVRRDREKQGIGNCATRLNGEATSVHNAVTFVAMRRFDEDEISLWHLVFLYKARQSWQSRLNEACSASPFLNFSCTRRS